MTCLNCGHDEEQHSAVGLGCYGETTTMETCVKDCREFVADLRRRAARAAA